MLFDLRGVLKEGESAIRIRTNHTIHYDQILVADVEEEWEPFAGKPLMCREQEVPLRGAELRRLGYPRRTLPDGRLPEVFDYQEIEPHSEWSVHRGFLTRLGDVTPLLAAADDMFAVMGHGEEVALTFEGRSLAKLPDGWKRTFVFYSVGYEKGFEMWSAHSRTIEPLPFKAMKGYPPTEGSYPLDEEHIRYLMEWNTRPSLFR
jgi:hypothetical protein